MLSDGLVEPGSQPCPNKELPALDMPELALMGVPAMGAGLKVLSVGLVEPGSQTCPE